ncbi:MAG: hypothetical protein EP330_00900 [Deltaproteobacteria bacterium]|nr:MAG: hypothetical protein EP330_00900 [Deltaproteobacteria bacterium]
MANPWKVYQTPKSNSWIIDFHYRDEHGLPQRFRRSAGRGVGKAEAQRKARALYHEMQRDPIAFVDTIERGRRTRADARPFTQVADDYYEQYVLVRLKGTTIRSHEQILRVHLKPYFASTDIRGIGKAEVDTYMGSKRRAGLSKKSVNNHLSVLSSVFAFAHERGWVAENPTKKKRLKVEQTGFNWIDAETSVGFLAAIRAQDPHYYPVFLAALRTGMRQGELIALRWQNVRLDAAQPYIEVRHSRSHGVTTSTKGNRVRHVGIHPELAAVLHPLRGQPGDLVFTSTSGQQLTGNVLKNPMRRAKAAIGRPELRFHDLRHSFASQLTARGIALQVVQGLLGHSEVSTTAKYSHPTASLAFEAIATLGDAVPALAAK